MKEFKFKNLKKILDYINLLKQTPTAYNSVFSTLKKMLLFTILYLLVTAVAALVVIFSVNKNTKIVTVPKVVNKEFFYAYKSLHERGLNVDIDLRYYNNIPRGVVTYQSIEPLKEVKENRIIKVIVSLGAPKKVVTKSTNEIEVRSYVINFKLPDNYDTGKVKIVIDDEKEKGRVVFNDVINKTNVIRFAVKIYGNGSEKIFINDELYLEKEIE